MRFLCLMMTNGYRISRGGGADSKEEIQAITLGYSPLPPNLAPPWIRQF